MTMSPDAIEACARYIERLEADIDRWREAYARLTTNRLTWAQRALLHERPCTRKRVLGKLQAQLRKTW
jgi:hypothetical protein